LVRKASYFGSTCRRVTHVALDPVINTYRKLKRIAGAAQLKRTSFGKLNREHPERAIGHAAPSGRASRSQAGGPNRALDARPQRGNPPGQASRGPKRAAPSGPTHLKAQVGKSMSVSRGPFRASFAQPSRRPQPGTRCAAPAGQPSRASFAWPQAGSPKRANTFEGPSG